jgi:LPXTG-motif cell wall-anchored protein
VQDDGITIKIVNVRGASLPSTGGAGTGAFTVLGSVLALGAGWLLFRRRMQIM